MLSDRIEFVFILLWQEDFLCFHGSFYKISFSGWHINTIAFKWSSFSSLGWCFSGQILQTSHCILPVLEYIIVPLIIYLCLFSLEILAALEERHTSWIWLWLKFCRHLGKPTSDFRLHFFVHLGILPFLLFPFFQKNKREFQISVLLLLPFISLKS